MQMRLFSRLSLWFHTSSPVEMNVWSLEIVTLKKLMRAEMYIGANCCIMNLIIVPHSSLLFILANSLFKNSLQQREIEIMFLQFKDRENYEDPID